MTAPPRPSSRRRARGPAPDGDWAQSSSSASASYGPSLPPTELAAWNAEVPHANYQAPPLAAPAVSPAGEFPLRTLADAPVGDDAADRLGYGDIADGVARLIEGDETATPLTIAVSAPWGAGKTSLLRLVENRLVRQRIARGDAPAIVVWFNAWMHDAAPNLSAALAADVARHATRYRDPWTRLRHPLPSSMLSPQERAQRRFWLGVVAVISAIALCPIVSSLIGPPDRDVTMVRAAFGASAAGWFALLWGVSVLWPRVQRSVAAVAAFVDDPRSAAATGSMAEVAAQLGELIQQAQEGARRAWRASHRPRFVVVIDDLERCQPPKAVDMCEVAAQLLNQLDVVTVLLGDLQVIAVSAELKYPGAAELFSNDADFADEGFGRSYLQKVVQFELQLPPISEERIGQLARPAPEAASIYRSGADRPTPMPSLPRQLLRLPEILSYRQRQIKKLRAEVKESAKNVISDVLAQSGSSAASTDLEAEIIDRVKDETAAKYEGRRFWRYAQDLASAEEVHRRLQQRVTNPREETRTRAEKAILQQPQLLPPLPRTTKRLLNRLYFLLVVAYNRHLITLGQVSGEQLVSPEQLAKWAVLLDRWPEAGKAIVKDPQLAQALEAAAGREDDFASLCSTCTPPLAGNLAHLRDLFRTDHKLAAVAHHLAYLDADVKPRPPATPRCRS